MDSDIIAPGAHERQYKPSLVGTTKAVAVTQEKILEKQPPSTCGSSVLELDSDVRSGTESTTRQDVLFKSAQWSGDGTSILASRDNNSVEIYILPPDLLTGAVPHHLQPYAVQIFPAPVYAVATYPFYQLNEPSSTLYLASPASVPIRLLSPFSSGIIASYPLVNKTTEAYIAPHSLLFGLSARNSNHFFAGSDSQISVFDISRNGEGPIEEMRTIPSRRKKLVGGGIGMKGIVSALSMSCEGILAAGTFSRWIGLYDGEGRGGTVGVFELGRDATDPDGIGDGSGVTQVAWSPCGRYLCTAERQSGGIGVWDIRGTGKRLAWLSDRAARTMQRLSFDMVGYDIWAGGTDGKVRLWKSTGEEEGIRQPSWEFEGHKDTISSASMHSCGNILATCSGQWHFASDNFAKDQDPDADLSSSDGSGRGAPRGHDKDTGVKDFSLKVWTL